MYRKASSSLCFRPFFRTPPKLVSSFPATAGGRQRAQNTSSRRFNLTTSAWQPGCVPPALCVPRVIEPDKAVTGTLLLVDGTGLVVRSNRGRLFPPLESFFDGLASVILLTKPSHVAIAFDHPGPTFRHQLSSRYKWNRRHSPSVISREVTRVDGSIQALLLRQLSVPWVEADDVIGSLTVVGLQQGMQVHIASQDKDYYQLLGPRVSILQYLNHGNPVAEYTEADFILEFGILPSQYIDLLALTGDRSDLVEGVPGIGKKRAAKLLGEYHSVESLFMNLPDLADKRVKEMLSGREARALLAKELVTLRAVGGVGQLASMAVNLEHDAADCFRMMLEFPGPGQPLEGVYIRLEQMLECLLERASLV